MADTNVYYSGLLSTIDTKISGLISSPEVDYRVGSVSVSASQKMDQLIKMRELILKRMKEKPSEAFETLQDDFTAFGEDLNSFINGTP